MLTPDDVDVLTVDDLRGLVVETIRRTYLDAYPEMKRHERRFPTGPDQFRYRAKLVSEMSEQELKAAVSRLYM